MHCTICTVEDIKRIIQMKTLETIFQEFERHLENSFLDWESFEKQERIATYTEHGPLELMPISNKNLYSFKYVNCHNKNPESNLLSVVGFGMIASVLTGYPLCVSEMTILTAIRTACTSALVAKHLIDETFETMAIIGNGCQCEFQAVAFQTICNVKNIVLFDVDKKASKKAFENLQHRMNVSIADNIQEAVVSADIITTCTNVSNHACLIPDEWLPANVHINAIGGDRPGKTELDEKTLERADIYVEFIPQTRMEGEIQRCPDCKVTEIHELFRSTNEKRCGLTIFDSVGFALEDFSILEYIYKVISDHECSSSKLIVDAANPKDLFSTLA